MEEIFRKHGSVLPFLETDEMKDRFFREVHDSISLSCLRECSLISHATGTSLTGYDNLDIQSHRAALDSLKALASCDIPIVIASNSPAAHVRRVLDLLGLSEMQTSLLSTPDVNGQRTSKSDKNFWKVLLSKYPPDVYNITLLDDSMVNCDVANEVGIDATHVNNEVTFATALLKFLDLLNPEYMIIPDGNSTSVFNFNAVDYLRAKNSLDDISYSKEILSKLGQEVHDLRLSRIMSERNSKSSLLKETDEIINNTDFNVINSTVDVSDANKTFGDTNEGEEGSFVIVDLGAGVLNMLKHVFMLSNNLIERGDDFQSLTYVAYESNTELLEFCRTKLLGLGFHECFPEEYPDGLTNSLCFQLNLPTGKPIVQWRFQFSCC